MNQKRRTKTLFAGSAPLGLSKVPPAIQLKFFAWVTAIQIAGLREVRRYPGFHEEIHVTERGQHHSVRLSRSWRAVYAGKTHASSFIARWVRHIERTHGPMTLGKLVRAFRKAESLSRIHFASRLKLPHSQLIQIEGDRYRLPMARVRLIARRLGVPDSVLAQLAQLSMRLPIKRE